MKKMPAFFPRIIPSGYFLPVSYLKPANDDPPLPRPHKPACKWRKGSLHNIYKTYLPAFWQNSA